MSVEAVGLHELIKTFERLSRGLTSEQVLPMEALFARTFTEVEGAVHVFSGALKASGEATTGSDGPGNWWGQATFRDPAAIFELAHGGSHWFFRPMDEAEAEFEQVAMDVLEAAALE